MKLSNQAAGALMMTLQKCLMEQSDIMPLLEELNFEAGDDGELVVLNPPSLKIDESKLDKDLLDNA
tara:strand:- start:710 stop:907 length:198 start_codon:yes stop_codon:yes gene_type:complete